MNLKHETKEVLLCASLFGIACIIVLSMVSSMSGCTTTGTDSLISDSTVKAITEAVSKLDKEQVKKLEEVIKEKLNDDNTKPETKTEDSNVNQQTEETQVVETPQGTVKDVEVLSSLKWRESGDECHIVQCYFGDGHDSELFKMIAGLPVDFTCTLDNSGVTISCPASDDTGRMASYPGDHMMARRAFVCLFNSDNNLVECQDFAESFHLDNRWKDKGAVKGLVVHVKQGNAVSRTALTEVK